MSNIVVCLQFLQKWNSSPKDETKLRKKKMKLSTNLCNTYDNYKLLCVCKYHKLMQICQTRC